MASMECWKRDCSAVANNHYSLCACFFFFSSRRRHTRFDCDWSSDVCSSDLMAASVIVLVMEYQRLVGFPITKTITDAAIPASVAYQEDKLQACYDLATVLDEIGRASCRERV